MHTPKETTNVCPWMTERTASALMLGRCRMPLNSHLGARAADLAAGLAFSLCLYCLLGVREIIIRILLSRDNPQHLAPRRSSVSVSRLCYYCCYPCHWRWGTLSLLRCSCLFSALCIIILLAEGFFNLAVCEVTSFIIRDI